MWEDQLPLSLLVLEYRKLVVFHNSSLVVKYLLYIYRIGVDEDQEHAAQPGTPHRVIKGLFTCFSGDKSFLLPDLLLTNLMFIVLAFNPGLSFLTFFLS